MDSLATRVVRERYRVVFSSAEQEYYVSQLLGSTRFVYNKFLEKTEEQYYRKLAGEIENVSLNEIVSSFAKKNLSGDLGWLADFPAWTVQNAAIGAEKAYLNWWDKSKQQKKPKFKKKGKTKDTAHFKRPTKSNFRVEKLNRNNARVFLGNSVGWVRFKLSRKSVPFEPSSVTLVKESDGRVFVSFVVEQEIVPLQWNPDTDRVSNIDGNVFAGDLGLIDLLSWVSNNGERGRIDNPRFLKRKQRKLGREQRKLARMWGPSNIEFREKKKKNKKIVESKNYSQQKKKVARLHSMIRDARADYHRKVALNIANNNQVVCLETLNVSGLKRNKKLANSISDVSWSSLVDSIRNACEKTGVSLIQVGQWEPTSQVCCVCGVRGGKLPLKVKEWQCGDCGVWLDRDWNAAVNVLLAAGLVESLNACGDDVRQLLASIANNAIVNETRSYITSNH